MLPMLCCRQSEKKPAKAPQKYGRGLEPKTGKKCSGISRNAAQLAGTRAETQQSGNPKKQPPADRDAQGPEDPDHRSRSLERSGLALSSTKRKDRVKHSRV